MICQMTVDLHVWNDFFLAEKINGLDFCSLVGPSPGEDMGDDEEVEM